MLQEWTIPLTIDNLQALNAIVSVIYQEGGDIDPETNTAFVIAEAEGWILEVEDLEHLDEMWRVARIYDGDNELTIFVCETPEEGDDGDGGERARLVA